MNFDSYRFLRWPLHSLNMYLHFDKNELIFPSPKIMKKKIKSNQFFLKLMKIEQSTCLLTAILFFCRRTAGVSGKKPKMTANRIVNTVTNIGVT